MLTHPVPSPNCNEFTINDEIVATLETVRLVVVREEATRDPVLTENELTKGGIEDKYLDNVAVDTKLRRFGVETYPGAKSVAVETKLRRLAVLT
jgi:hypothetical protein